VIDAFIDSWLTIPCPKEPKPCASCSGLARHRSSFSMCLIVPPSILRSARPLGSAQSPLRRPGQCAVARMAREKDRLLRRLPPHRIFRIGSKAGFVPPMRTMLLQSSILSEPPAIDLTVKSDPDGWAARLGGVLPTGSVRIARPEGPVSGLEGYDDGDWWVQDAAASIPAQMFSRLEGLDIVDLCAAPGGKTAQLALAGARVTACDQSANQARAVARAT
jgi:hypothetical protein